MVAGVSSSTKRIRARPINFPGTRSSALSTARSRGSRSTICKRSTCRPERRKMNAASRASAPHRPSVEPCSQPCAALMVKAYEIITLIRRSAGTQPYLTLIAIDPLTHRLYFEHHKAARSKLAPLAQGFRVKHFGSCLLSSGSFLISQDEGEAVNSTCRFGRVVFPCRFSNEHCHARCARTAGDDVAGGARRSRTV